MKTQTIPEGEMKNELFEMIDKYFPKIKPNGVNKGRGEAMVIVARALYFIESIRSSTLTEVEGMVEKLKITAIHKSKGFPEHHNNDRYETNDCKACETAEQDKVHNKALSAVLTRIKQMKDTA